MASHRELKIQPTNWYVNLISLYYYFYQILPTSTIRNVLKQVRRICLFTVVNTVFNIYTLTN